MPRAEVRGLRPQVILNGSIEGRVGEAEGAGEVGGGEEAVGPVGARGGAAAGLLLGEEPPPADEGLQLQL